MIRPAVLFFLSIELLLACSLLLAVIRVSVSALDVDTKSWKMADRFHAFRYELTYADSEMVRAEIQSIVTLADSKGCFGWIQKKKSGYAVVGEARCPKTAGIELQRWMHEAAKADADSMVRTGP
jgi:hypothetical protein